MKRLMLLTCAFLVGTHSAQSQDKGSFVPYKNAFYQNIKQQLNQHEQSGSGGSTSFKMDPSGIN
ncbi:MAG: hypothetical protein ACFB10_14505, partial [Salibacteraceae bacterium]